MLDIFKRNYVARRYEQQQWKGGYERSPHRDFTVMLNVQPLTADELQALPEGERGVKRFKAFGATTLRGADVKAGTKADLVYIGGDWYEVRSSNDWRHISILSHNYVELVLVNNQPAPPKEGLH